MRLDITVGSTFPDYELPDHTNTLRRLSFLQGHDPLVLTLNRGAFCPKDRQHLQQFISLGSNGRKSDSANVGEINLWI